MNDKSNLEQNLFTTYEKSIKNLFEGISDKEISPDLFSHTTRGLLVHNILTNIEMHHSNRKQVYDTLKVLVRSNPLLDSIHSMVISDEDGSKFDRGLDFMLSERFFKHAFVLHDETSHSSLMQDLIEKAGKIFSNDDHIDKEKIEKNKLNVGDFETRDTRDELNAKWASLRAMFKFQPLNLVRSYFGEEVAFYFSWVGCLITCLWVPSFIGILFFFIGLGISIRKAQQTTNR